MGKPRILVLRTAGTNCDIEAMHAVETAGGEADRVHVERLLGNGDLLDRYHMLFLPGGFSYGDDLGGGRILANELRTLLDGSLGRFIERGNLILGICNGFQVLVKSGILPGNRADREPTVTLTHNDSHRFEDRWIHVKAVSERSVFVEKDALLYLPVAHAEGKFIPKSPQVMQELEQEDLVVFQYVDGRGNACDYPGNPNGSVGSVAGITNPTGRILGLMPHPDRHVFRYQHPYWTRLQNECDGDGLEIFRRAVRVAQEELV